MTGKRQFENLQSLIPWKILKNALRRQSHLPPHPLEIPEVLFDRLLLHESNEYRAIRKLVRNNKLRLLPRMGAESLLKSDSRVIFYAPIQSELAWLVEIGPDATFELIRLLKYQNSIYETSLAVLSRHLGKDLHSNVRRSMILREVRSLSPTLLSLRVLKTNTAN